MIAKVIILIVLIALHYKPTFSSELEPTTEGSTTGVTADPIITNLKSELCRGDAILYKDCQYKEVAGKVTKRNGRMGYENVKFWNAVAIEVPKGCKATLYNEEKRYGVNLQGPKKYCSKSVYDNGIHIVSLQDVADVEMVAKELVKTESKLVQTENSFTRFEKNMGKNMDAYKEQLERKVERIQKMQGPKGDRGATGQQGIQGQQGLRGPKGIQGTKGEKGVQGIRGATGNQGIQGVKGEKGDQGVQGEKGEQGTPGLGLKYTTFALNKNFVKGEYVFSRSIKDALHDSMFIAEKSFNSKQKMPYQDVDSGNWIEFAAPRGRDGKVGRKGATGARGLQGEKGDQGPQGDQGAKGEQGIVGPDGKQGTQGIAGTDGEKGDTGPQGPRGNIGTQGAQGEQGVQGVQGEKGERGLQGNIGSKGEKGEQGIVGPKGEKGNKGEEGDDGIGLTMKLFRLGGKYNRGDYIFEKSTRNHEEKTMYIAQRSFTANVEPRVDVNGDWVEFHAPKGPAGEKGEQGIQGAKGEKGEKGETGPQGIQGPQGTAGLRGSTGPKGEQGTPGAVQWRATEVRSGTCASNGCERYTSAAACETAAREIGWSDKIVDSGSASGVSHIPQDRCYFKEKNNNMRQLWYNNRTPPNTGECNAIRACACSCPPLKKPTDHPMVYRL